MEIQRLGIDDWQRLKKLRLAALKDAPGAFASTLENANHYTEDDWRRGIKALATFVAAYNGEDCGMVRGASNDMDNSSAWLLSMWVAPSGRGKGAGDRLIEALLKWAREKGYARLELDVANDNNFAIALYERYNFLPTGETGNLPEPRSHIQEHRRALIL